MIFLLIPAILCILTAALGFGLAAYAMNGKRQTLEEARAWQEAHYNLGFYDALEKTDYTVESDDGYTLHAQFLRNPKNTSRCVLISHGYTDNRFGALKYARMYLEMGFNVIVYDLRGHGLNAPTFCTYTVRERKDLLRMILDSRARYPEMTLLGIHGESLGAATSVAVLEEKPPVDFVVADCPFCDIVPVLKNGLKGMRLPAFLVHAASVCARIRYGVSFKMMRPIDCLKGNTVPILFIHGADDTFIPPEHSKRLKAASAGHAEMRLIPGAGHAMSVLTDPEAYAGYVRAFLILFSN